MSFFQCDKCNRKFKGDRGWKNHLVKGCRFHVCQVCNKTFKKISGLKKHESTHSKEKSSSCPICSKKINNRGMASHLLTHEGVKECDKCQRKFKGPNGFKVHLKKGCCENICKVCNKQFSTLSLFKRHQTTHTGEQRVSCPICNKSLYHNGALKTHMKHVHDKSRFPKLNLPKLIKCDLCKSNLTTNNENYRHFTNCHKKLCLGKYDERFEINGTIKCTFCQQLIKVEDYALHKHMELSEALYRGQGMQTKKCGKCHHFFTPIQYKLHVDVHKRKDEFSDEDNVWKCKKCGNTFDSPSARISHEKYCGTLLNYVNSCLFCGKMCKNYSLLEDHMRSHTGEKPYFCNICELFFPTKSGLNQHFKKNKHKINAGEMVKPKAINVSRNRKFPMVDTPSVPVFICSQCKFQATTKKDMSNHVEEHHQLKLPQNCKDDGSNFTSNEGDTYKLINGKPKCHTCYICSKSFYGPVIARVHVQLCEWKHGVVKEESEVEIESFGINNTADDPEFPMPCFVLVKH